MTDRAPFSARAVFVEAARAGSFRIAAARLSVTPGAVSRRIRELEARIGHAVFERTAQGVVLNTTGAALLARVGPALDTVARAWRDASTDAEADAVSSIPRSVSISAPPSFIDHWLAPRLARRATDLPEIMLERSQAFIAPSWQGERIDLAVRYGRGPWPGVRHRVLMTDALVPVVPAGHSLARHHGPPTARALAGRPLFEVRWPARESLDRRGVLPGWPDWLVAQDLAVDGADIDARHTRFDTAMAAATSCNGVVLASRVIVADQLATGQWVAPFGIDRVVASPFIYALILPTDESPPPAATAVIDWLIAEAAIFARAGS